MMVMQFIPVNMPLLDGNEKKYLAECIDSGWISSEGPFVSRLEEEFTRRVERKYGIAVCNGSAALDLAIAALELGPGDEVILPTFTIISCAAALVRAGVRPVVVDSDPMTWNMDVNKIEEKISSKTKGIMVVHIYGLPVDMDPVLSIAEKYDLKVIEDAAEAHGLNYKNKPCGSFGDLSTFSFYPNKLITTGEGGMVLTDNEEISESCRSLRNLCFQKDRRFKHRRMGWNFRMSNIQAAIGVAQLERLDLFVEKKKNIGKRYTELLKDIPNLQLPLAQTSYAENIYWVYGMMIKDNTVLDAELLAKKLNMLNIGTRPFFWPIHQQPVLRDMGLFHQESCPVAENLAKNGLYVPSGLPLTEDQLQIVADRVRRVLTGL
jgi:perosamine synthetase